MIDLLFVQNETQKNYLLMYSNTHDLKIAVEINTQSANVIIENQFLVSKNSNGEVIAIAFQITNQFMKTLGIAVLALGIIMTIFTGFNIITKKKVVDIGPLEINKEEKTPIYWSPVTGGILIIAGVIIMVAGRRRA
jgi:hypothetical protein